MNFQETDFNLTTYLNEKHNRINNALDKILQDCKNSSQIVKAMRYSLMAGGKRIRPVVCMAAAEAVGSDCEVALPAACALEMIHAYSLIHDDLPAMDDDDLRRGKPTCHVAFDEATAILAGDALLTLAFHVLSTATHTKESQVSSIWLNIIQIIALAAGCKGMIEGQMRDISSEGTLLSLKDLENMHALKTGALIEASILSGAILGNGNPEQIEHLGIYGKNLGLAFQVTDDILNVEGDPAIMGKAAGTDKNRKKSTYPSLLGLNKSKDFAKNIINNALQAIESFDNKADPLRAIATYVLKRKK